MLNQQGGGNRGEFELASPGRASRSWKGLGGYPDRAARGCRRRGAKGRRAAIPSLM